MTTCRCRYMIFKKGNFSGWRPVTRARKIKPTSARQTGLPSRSPRWEDMALGILSLTLFCFLRRFHCSPPTLLQWTSKKVDSWRLPNTCGPQPAPASVAAWDPGPGVIFHSLSSWPEEEGPYLTCHCSTWTKVRLTVRKSCSQDKGLQRWIINNSWELEADGKCEARVNKRKKH